MGLILSAVSLGLIDNTLPGRLAGQLLPVPGDRLAGSRRDPATYSELLGWKTDDQPMCA
jgi:hypothetical protein